MAISAKEMPKNHTDKERFAAALSCIQTGILTLLFSLKRRRSSPSPFVSRRVLDLKVPNKCNARGLPWVRALRREYLCKHGRVPFDQKFLNCRNGNKCHGNFLGKALENTAIVEFPKSEPFKRKFRKFRDESQMERKFPGKTFRNFVYTERGCPLFRNLCKFQIFHSALASCFGRDHSESDISCMQG